MRNARIWDGVTLVLLILVALGYFSLVLGFWE